MTICILLYLLLWSVANDYQCEEEIAVVLNDISGSGSLEEDEVMPALIALDDDDGMPTLIAAGFATEIMCAYANTLSAESSLILAVAVTTGISGDIGSHSVR